MWNQTFGKNGEELAAGYLVEQGVEILAKNQRTGYGEIDLIGLHQGDLVFFEIKTRTSTKYGYPELAITEMKLQHMIDCASEYMQSQNLSCNMRIDVIAVLWKDKKTKAEIEWIKNVTESH